MAMAATANTNSFTLILTYALLEWILILFLLFTSLLSRLAVKFAEVFGLKPPCPWCARLFEARVDIICELHAKDISQLCCCSNHRKLADDCSPRFGESASEIGTANSSCSCCGVRLDDYALFSSYMLLKTLSWNLVKQKSIARDCCHELLCDVNEINENVVVNDEYSGHKLVAADNITEDQSRSKCDFNKFEDHENVQVEGNEGLVLGVDLNQVPMLPSVEMEESLQVFHAKEFQLDDHTEAAPMESSENEANISIQIDIPDLNVNQESYECTHLGDVQVLGTKESLDVDVTNIQRLNSELRAQQGSLQALYAELEEERNCSEVAANQTMSMINRLQEEKAAVQMEAFQYQRLMEEQSEYDQEALQLLNDLLVKREKENQELAKELEACKMKILDYETKEYNNWIMSFEHERLSILRQLQVLEDNDFVKEINGKSIFDANHAENGNGNGFDSNGVHNCYISKEDKTVCGLHERLEALDSDRDFFKNCVGSLRKGEKGIGVLQEILPNLRHLRDLELPHALTLVGTKEEDEFMCVV